MEKRLEVGRMTCLNAKCGKDFQPVKKWQRFCSNKCRDSYHNAAKKLHKAVVLLIPNFLLLTWSLSSSGLA